MHLELVPFKLRFSKSAKIPSRGLLISAIPFPSKSTPLVVVFFSMSVAAALVIASLGCSLGLCSSTVLVSRLLGFLVISVLLFL
ncbi:hypothetical protein RchiOBHm_Chr4g0414431 [Rosa chinensis]|uniref:Transmembrane protein n=1 Tax=Rosa chinensis TaxID=74649 RepID=A0A2P6QWE8_ROSCH|nr:hypothetical protein RchiOBHm_Chr4g0414431 [Rosa chinensis]